MGRQGLHPVAVTDPETMRPVWTAPAGDIGGPIPFPGIDDGAISPARRGALVSRLMG